jgi:hypothetical protein
MESQQPISVAQHHDSTDTSTVTVDDAVEAEEIMPYIGGWILKKMLAFSCDICKDQLVTDVSSAKIFQHKNFENAKLGLTQPSSECVAVLCRMEQLFRQEMEEASSTDGILATVVGRFEREGVHPPFCTEHFYDSSIRAWRLFVTTRLHHWCRERMKALRKERHAAASKRKLKKLN